MGNANGRAGSAGNGNGHGVGKVDIADLKSRIRIEDVIGERIELVPEAGGAKLRGLCPFHDDTDPSFLVNVEQQLWNCFSTSCSGPKGRSGGDVFDFLVRYEKLRLPEVLDLLCQQIGIDPPSWIPKRAGAIPAKGNGHRSSNGQASRKDESSSLPGDPVSPERRRKLLDRVVAAYHGDLLADPDRTALDYLASRGLAGETGERLVAKHRLGHATWTSLKSRLPAKTNGVDNDVVTELKTLGVLQGLGLDRFAGRVVLPLLDSADQVVNLVGRQIDETQRGPRYMTLPGEPLPGIFNRQCLASAEWVILVEGVFDALSLEAVGLENAIPLLGTTLRDELVTALRGAAVRQVVIMLDGGAGNAAAAIADRLGREIDGLDVRVAELPAGLDPNDLLIAEPPERLRAIVEQARGEATAAPTSEAVEAASEDDHTYRVRFEDRTYIAQAIEKRGRRLHVTLRADAGTRFHLDTLNLYLHRDRKNFAKEAALLFRTEYAVIDRDLSRILERIEDLVARREKGPARQAAVAVSDGVKLEAIEMGRAGDVLDALARDAPALGVVGEQANLAAMYLLVTSRRMSDPLSILFLSGSGAGKSLVQDRVLSLCPSEDLILLTALTGRSLFYRGESLRGKVLAIREEAGARSAGYALRALISDKELVVEATVKDPVTGRLTTMTNRVEGPPAVSVTTASPTTDPETASRFLILSIDESVEQTQRILEHQRHAQTLEGIMARRNRDAIVERHQVFQRMLEPVEVVNPFADLLTFPVESMKARRGQPMYLTLIRAVAFLRQMAKERRSVEMPGGRGSGGRLEYVDVDLVDIRIAHGLAHRLLGGTVDDLSDVGRKLLEEIDAHVSRKEKDLGVPRHEITFSRREIREATGRGDFQVRTYLEELVGLEYVVSVQGGQGRQSLYILDYHGEAEKRERFALGLVEIEDLERMARERGLVS